MQKLKSGAYNSNKGKRNPIHGTHHYYSLWGNIVFRSKQIQYIIEWHRINISFSFS